MLECIPQFNIFYLNVVDMRIKCKMHISRKRPTVYLIFLFLILTTYVSFLVLNWHLVPFTESTRDNVQRVISTDQIQPNHIIKKNISRQLDVSEITYIIKNYNEKQQIYNKDIFDPVQNDTIIIVVQVHTRILYLSQLISSMAQVRNISQALLIFSHDYYDKEINELIESIRFCKVLQIFFPYSIQTHPFEFPGEDVNCLHAISGLGTVTKPCTINNDGKKRNVKTLQTKHHWWWKANHVFNTLEVTRHHTGLVVFLEEDQYLAEDFIYILNLMDKTSKTTCRECNIYCLGDNTESFGSYQNFNQAVISSWITSWGMTFNRSTWTEIVKCADLFCTYDDYNWDWTLQFIKQTCISVKIQVMHTLVPRVFHIGTCGTHYKNKDCSPNLIVSKIQTLLKTAKNQLYPSSLGLSQDNWIKMVSKSNGGWSDVRDHQLCKNLTISPR